MRKAPLPFLALGIAFIAFGFSGQRNFIYVGLVFIFIALIFLLRSRRG